MTRSNLNVLNLISCIVQCDVVSRTGGYVGLVRYIQGGGGQLRHCTTRCHAQVSADRYIGQLDGSSRIDTHTATNIRIARLSERSTSVDRHIHGGASRDTASLRNGSSCINREIGSGGDRAQGHGTAVVDRSVGAVLDVRRKCSGKMIVV